MTLWDAFQMFLLGLGMACLWGLWFAYKRFQIEKTRQQLFVIRDDLFMAAACGEIALNAPAYKTMRKLLNGSIRYVERISLWRIVATHRILEAHDLEERFTHRLKMEMKGLSHAQRHLLWRSLQQADDALVHHLVHSNMLLLCVVELARVFHLTQQVARWGRDRFGDPAKTMNGDIYAGALHTV